MTKPGRTARKAAPIAEPELDQDKVTGAMAQMRSDAQGEVATRNLEIFDLGHKVGAIHMARLQADFSAAAEVSLFAEIQKSNAFKHLALPGPGGTSAVAENAEDFCRLVFGDGYKAMNERKLSLEALGVSAYENAVRLGLNRRQLRLVRALPEDKREAVQSALQSTNKAEVAALVEDLAAQLAEAQQATAEANAEKEAADQLLDKKNKKIDQLERDKKRIAKLPPDEQLAELQKEATAIMNDAVGAIRGGLRQALIALQNHGDEDNSVFMAGLVGQLQADLKALRDEFNLPDVSNAADLQLAREVGQWAGK